MNTENQAPMNASIVPQEPLFQFIEHGGRFRRRATKAAYVLLLSGSCVSAVESSAMLIFLVPMLLLATVVGNVLASRRLIRVQQDGVYSSFGPPLRVQHRRISGRFGPESVRAVEDGWIVVSSTGEMIVYVPSQDFSLSSGSILTDEARAVEQLSRTKSIDLGSI